MQAKSLSRVIAAFLLVAGLATIAAADVRLPAVISDHMVLQQEMAVPIWGWAEPGEKVTVTFDGQTKTATACREGKWSVKLDPLKAAGGPKVLTVQGNNTLKVDDVLVGEVWLGSGQSNMAMTVSRSRDFDQEKAAADLPQVRMFTVDRKTAETPQDNCGGSWQVTTPVTVGSFSAAAYFFGRELHKQLDVPVGMINSSWGGTPVQAWTSMPAQKKLPELASLLDQWKQRIATFDAVKAKAAADKQIERWKEAVAKAKADGKPAPRRPRIAGDPKTDPHRPANLYNGMIAPLAPFALRGAIWYQGESNANRYESSLYGLQLRAMITNWRDVWGEGDFPFIYVQLPLFHQPQQQPSEPTGWVTIREEMLRSLALKNTGMAITVDVGEAGDIHPKNKQEVGRRLALWALANTYGKEIVGSGPIYKSMKKQGGKIVLQFDHVGGGLVATDGGPLEGFAVAGADMQFVWAKAKIVGDTVVVSSPEVADPVAVRYSWADNPKGNLANKEGLPASPFRTDEDPKPSPVSGTITLDGQPVAGATIIFHSEAGPAAQAVTNGEGKYEMAQPSGKKGVAPGEYRVTIQGPMRGGKSITPAKYGDAKTSGLQIDVRGAANVINVELQSE